MPTEQQTETPTRRQIAEAFVEKWTIFASPVDAVELLLKCRDERAARIAETHENCPEGCNFDISRAIRSEDHK